MPTFRVPPVYRVHLERNRRDAFEKLTSLNEAIRIDGLKPEDDRYLYRNGWFMQKNELEGYVRACDEALDMLEGIG